MPVLYSGCGQQVYLPERECTECDQFEARLEEVENTLPNKQNKLTAGNGISLSGNVISADTNELQEKLATGDWLHISGGDVIDIIHPVTPEIEFTVNTGTLVDYWVRKFGNIVFLSLEVDNDSDVASGEDYFNAVLETEDMLPVATATGGSYIGIHAMDGLIRPMNPPNGRTPGELVVRNASSSTFVASPDPTSDVVISFMYMV